MKKKKEERKERKDIDFLCGFCEHSVNKNEKFVKLSTFNATDSVTKKKFDKHVYYHWQCFLDQYQKGIDERIKERLGNSVEAIQNIMKNPIFKDLKIASEQAL